MNRYMTPARSTTDQSAHCRSDSEKAVKLATDGPHKIEETPRRVRGLFDSEWVFDTTHARHVWEYGLRATVSYFSIKQSLLLLDILITHYTMCH